MRDGPITSTRSRSDHDTASDARPRPTPILVVAFLACGGLPTALAAGGEAAPSALVEHEARREQAAKTVAAQWRLALWCEQNGLEAEATAHLTTVVQLDPTREAAWKRLGCRKYNGRWMTEAQIDAEKAEAQAREKADRHWLPQIADWKGQLADAGRHAEAQRQLADLTDPRAVPAIWRVFSHGKPADQAIAVQVLGQIDSARSSRALATLALFGASADVRRAATESLADRSPIHYADMLINLLRDPVRFEVVPVGGPGRPGSLTVEGKAFNLTRIYAPPPPPNIPIFPGESISFDERGLPVLVRNSDEIDIPLTYLHRGFLFPDRNIIKPQVPAVIQLGAMWLENRKSALAAQQQLRNDLVGVLRQNDLLHSANARIVLVLNQATGEDLPVDRRAWRAWGAERFGYAYPPTTAPPRPTLRQAVAPSYLPRNVGGLGFDPDVGYYTIVPWDY